MLRNSSLSFIHNIISKSANVIIVVILGRQYGTSQLGAFSLATTYLIVFTALTWGLDELLTRQVSRNKSQINQYYGAFLILRGIISLLLFGCLFIIIRFVLKYESNIDSTILVFGICLIPDSLSYVGKAILTSDERFGPQVIGALTSSTIKLSGSFFVIQSSSNLIGIGWSWVAGSLVETLIIFFIINKVFGKLDFNWVINRNFWTEHLRMGLPLLIISILISLEYQLDVILLKSTRSADEVGLYSAVTTIFFGLSLLSHAFQLAVYPRMVKYSLNSPDNLHRIYRLSFKYLGMFALPTAFGITILSGNIITLIFGKEFIPAIPSLIIITWALVVYYLNIPISRYMLVIDRQGLLSIIVASTLCLNIIINLLLGPRWGALGASIARLVSLTLFFIPNYLFIKRHKYSYNVIRLLYLPIICSLLMVLAILPVRNMNIIIPFSVGFFVYCTGLIVLNVITINERIWLKKSLANIFRT